MSDFNRLILVGHLTVDPVIKIVGDNALAQFAMACNRRSKKKDGTVVEDAMFIDIEAWGQLSDIASKYLKKGTCCLLEGRLRQAQWQAKDGTNRSKLLMVCESITLLDTGNKEDRKSAPRPNNAGVKTVEDIKKEVIAPSNAKSLDSKDDLDDLPF